MPSHRCHEYVDRVVFGESYGAIHRWIDQASQFFKQDHRRIHHIIYNSGGQRIVDPTESISLAFQPPRFQGVTALRTAEVYTLHSILDDVCSRNPRLRLALEILALADKGKPITALPPQIMVLVTRVLRR